MTTITVSQLYDELRSFTRSGLHFQRQRHYAMNHKQMKPWLAGDTTTPPSTYWPGFVDWCDLIAGHVAAGRRVERLRVHAEPMSECQAWELWLGKWNSEAGEVIRYLTDAAAARIGLTPDVGPEDWWLLDGERLILMPWNDDGEDLPMSLVQAPKAMAEATQWWDLGWAHAKPHSGSTDVVA